VADQRSDPESLLNWNERLIRIRRETPEFGWGLFRLLDSGDDAVMAHRCDWSPNAVLAVHNFADSKRSVSISLDEPYETIEDLLGTGDPPDGDPLRFDLEAFGFRWFRIRLERRKD
jgi:maltose alpha-D-glucosyltransferase / alpha-amylase